MLDLSFGCLSFEPLLIDVGLSLLPAHWLIEWVSVVVRTDPYEVRVYRRLIQAVS